MQTNQFLVKVRYQGYSLDLLVPTKQEAVSLVESIHSAAEQGKPYLTRPNAGMGLPVSVGAGYFSVGIHQQGEY